MKKILFCVLLLLLCSGCGKQKEDPISFITVTSEEARKAMEEESGFVIVDVRTKEEYMEGHIKDAINIPNEEIAEKAESILNDKDQKIYVYCRSGRRSKEACKKLIDLGYQQIIDFGGILDWKGEIVQ
ncbi:MAG: rhodanese-like domain-containing protein [Erysipelotrichaceae bacterium]|nr:rhodanese-like domain-containing protein [Erysipelotrichaceae bacterium]